MGVVKLALNDVCFTPESGRNRPMLIAAANDPQRTHALIPIYVLFRVPGLELRCRTRRVHPISGHEIKSKNNGIRLNSPTSREIPQNQ